LTPGAFTLIELLVVIAVVALLMSILLPSLDRAKKQAKLIVCRSNLRQWALAVCTYIQDNDGFFLHGNTGITGGWAWMEILRPYCSNDKVHLCPTASKVVNNYDYAAGGTFHAWNPGTVQDPLYGSYGLNGWLARPRAGQNQVFGRPVEKNWTKGTLKGAYIIPLILDCGIWDSWPLETDQPPAFEDAPVEHGVLNSEIKRFCMNRHDGGTNGAFMDCSARKVGLKEL
jgi:prepilin-type N-terminal cleavage/methylation domain-containing protein